jgi:ACR3 family arsenite transporter
MVLMWSYLARGNDGHTLVMVAIATAATLFGLASGAALATVVGVLIEVSVMLSLVEICKPTKHWFPREA